MNKTRTAHRTTHRSNPDLDLGDSDVKASLCRVIVNLVPGLGYCDIQTCYTASCAKLIHTPMPRSGGGCSRAAAGVYSAYTPSREARSAEPQGGSRGRSPREILEE